MASSLLSIAEDLDHAGLFWLPEIGDEITPRVEPGRVSILVDAQGMTPGQLRSVYLWLPNTEQLVHQLEARQAILSHAGLEMSECGMCYTSVVRVARATFEARAESLRASLAKVLRRLLLNQQSDEFH